MEVSTLVGNLAVPRRNGLPPQFTILRTTLGTGQPLLRGSQPIRCRASPAWIIDMLTVTGGGKTNDADINPSLAPSCQQRIGRDIITGQHQHPAPPLAFDLDRLHPTRHRAVQVYLHLADVAGLTLLQKSLQGSLFGGGNPQRDIPEILELYKLGHLNLDDMVTREYTPEQINDGYHDMLEGHDIRGIIRYTDADRA